MNPRMLLHRLTAIALMTLSGAAAATEQGKTLDWPVYGKR